MSSSTHIDHLRALARSLPDSAGVYFWEDEDGVVLYIGKAVNLRNRVTSYFSAARRDRRVREMVTRARSIRYEVVSTELEALFRESALIKEYKPHFNRLLLTSKAAYYLKIDRSRVDPYLETARSTSEDNCVYFGPFRSGRALRETVAFLHDVLPLRKCTQQKPRCRPCMYFQMHKCAAPALDELHRARHEDAIDRLYDLLDGREDRVIAWLERKRERLCESLMFEQAAEVQARIDVFAHIQRQNTLLEAAMQCRCVLVHQSPADDGPGRLLLVAHGHVVSTRDAVTPEAESVAAWVRAHEPVIRVLTQAQSPIDAALVFQRWVSTQRNRVRWVAFPSLDAREDLLDRVGYVLGTQAGALVGAR